MEVTIKNINDLAKFINNNELTRKQIDLLITNATGVWMSRKIPTNEVVPKLLEFIKQYPDVTQRPLFID